MAMRLNRKLSVIVPAYKEGKKIQKGLVKLEDELKKIGLDYEILLVCDGCEPTYQAAKDLAGHSIKVLKYDTNSGKGFALKYGAAKASGDLITFIDADMTIHPKEIDVFIRLLDDSDADIIIGSKRHPQSKVNYPMFRRVQSFVYQLLVSVLFQINAKDTQAGLKLLKRQVLLDVLPKAVVKTYAFDLELLVIAHHLGYTKIVEAPIEVEEQFATTVRLSSAFWVFLDTLAIFYRLHILKYYDRTLK